MKNLRFKSIYKDTMRCIYRNNFDKNYKNSILINIFYFFAPIIIAEILILFKFFLTDGSITYFITGISIFAGLFFNLLIVISDKMIKRKALLANTYRPTKDYAQQYKLMSERLIATISYAIFLSIVLIGVMFLTQMNYNVFDSKIDKGTVELIDLISDYFFNFLSYLLGLHFVSILFLILSKLYEVLMHEMNPQEFQEDTTESTETE